MRISANDNGNPLPRVVETIDLTPTWLAVLPLYVEIATSGTTLNSRNAAWSELRRMAELADAMVAAQKEARS